MQTTTWKILEPYRSLFELTSGHVSLQRTPRLCFAAAANNSYKIYDYRLVPRHLSPHFEGTVRAVLSEDEKTYVVLPSRVVYMHYYHMIRYWPIDESDSAVSIVKIGSAIVLTCSNTLTVVDTEGETKKIALPFEVRTMVHPITYVNKVIIASEKELELWNFNSLKKIFTFNDILAAEESHFEISTVEAAPVIDMAAVALQSGTIALLNMRTAKILFKLKQKYSAICMSFSEFGRPLLVTGSYSGSIVIWYLNEKRILGKLKHVHKGRIDNLLFIPGTSEFLSTSSQENCLKQWKYDEVEQNYFRILRERVGLPTATTSFDIQNNQDITLMSENNALVTSLLAENRSYILPRCLASRLPYHITHKNNKISIYHKQTIIKSIEIPKVPHTGCISLSGKHYFVATNDTVYKITQSDMISQRVEGNIKQVLTYQQHFVCVLTSKGTTLLDFDKLILMDELYIKDPITMKFNHQGNFLAVAKDSSIEVWDVGRRVKGREFAVYSTPVCVSYSQNNKYLFCSTYNCYLLIFSIVDSILYKVLKMPKVMIGHGMTPDGSLFISCFSDSRELNVWYSQVGRVSTTSEVEKIEFKTDIKKADTSQLRSYLHENKNFYEHQVEYDFYIESFLDSLADPYNETASSFTDLPVGRWMPLSHYDQIKERNTVQSQIEKKVYVPFFLTNKAELALKVREDHMKKEKEAVRSLTDTRDRLIASGKNKRIVMPVDETAEYAKKLFDQLKYLTTAEVDFEMRSWLLIPGRGANILLRMLSWFYDPSEIDLKVVYVSRIIRLLQEEILSPDVKEALSRLGPILYERWHPIELRLNTCLAVTTKNIVN